MEIKIKQSKLNEAIIGNCNMEVPEGTVETKGSVPEVYADAVNQRRNREKKIADDFKEQDKAIEEFAKESQKTESKPKGTPEMKKLHLSESLFEEALDNEDLNRRASDIVASIKEFIEKVKQPNISYEEIDNYDIKDMQKVVDKLDKFSKISSHKEGSMDESFTPNSKLYKQAEEIADYLEEFMNNDVVTSSDYLDDNDRGMLTDTYDLLMDFSHHYSTTMDDENVFEAVETPVKKRTRGANEERWGIDYSDTDLWLQIYDELDASLENEGTGQQVNRFLRPKKGERYQYIYPHGDNDIIVGAMKPEDFAYAKKVADYYRVTYDEPKEDKNPRTNQYYKWTMVIHIPKELEPVEKH